MKPCKNKQGSESEMILIKPLKNWLLVIFFDKRYYNENGFNN